MQSAGLTHGGFYAHFASKDAFLEAALKEIFAQSGERRRRIVAKGTPREALSAFIDFSFRNRIATIRRGLSDRGLELRPAASVEAFRAAFDAGVKNLVDEIGRWIAAVGLEDPENARSR